MARCELFQVQALALLPQSSRSLDDALLMPSLCNRCFDKLHDMGRDVEIRTSPFMPEPCVMCSEPTMDRGVSWTNWEKAPYYPIKK